MTAEQAYAQIEKEMLEVCFAMQKFDSMVYARHLTVETNHKPLIAMVKKNKPLATAPKRLQRTLLKLQR
jgi:hypothetical protein